MRAQTLGTLSVSLVPAPDGAPLSGGNPAQRSLNLGTVSYNGLSTVPNVTVTTQVGSFLVTTRFAIAIQDATQQVSAATVLVGLAAPESFFTLRLDSLTLSPTPQVVQAQAKVGSTIEHRLDVQVPTSLTERNSQLQNTLLFQVIAN
ncbi:MAG TPA: hypothetical protein VE783_10735 [Candidatus Limnocylindrales bacterium]|jgi:hypothetical protein|nr:hypothetical protein [Candidatus Limnocylindrales bacterium]